MWRVAAGRVHLWPLQVRRQSDRRADRAAAKPWRAFARAASHPAPFEPCWPKPSTPEITMWGSIGKPCIAISLVQSPPRLKRFSSACATPDPSLPWLPLNAMPSQMWSQRL